uniref:Uncharacterized protein n=1 Tax=Arundo donax TaxID=35708 RepID=A0A0A9CYG9_ARUDO
MQLFILLELNNEPKLRPSTMPDAKIDGYFVYDYNLTNLILTDTAFDYLHYSTAMADYHYKILTKFLIHPAPNTFELRLKIEDVTKTNKARQIHIPSIKLIQLYLKPSFDCILFVGYPIVTNALQILYAHIFILYLYLLKFYTFYLSNTYFIIV